MEVPESLSSLFGSAEGCFGCRPRLRMETIERMLNENVFDFACSYVRFIQKRARLQSVTAAVWSLELRVFRKRDRRVGVAAVG